MSGVCFQRAVGQCMKRRAVSLAVFTGLGVFAAGGWAAAPQSQPGAGEGPHEATLLKAINFALTGTDYEYFVFTDHPNCIVTSTRPTTQPGVQIIETYYLNSINAARIAIHKIKTESQLGVAYSTQVELHGESVIREIKYQPATGPVIPANSAELDLQTTEYDRVVRAWKYIYAHGCKGAVSSF